MKLLMNFPLYDGCLKEYGSMAGVAADCEELGLDGLEVIWDHMPYTEELPPKDLAVGYHLMFWSNWVDFWKGDHDALVREFGDEALIEEYYHGTTRADMVARYRADIQHAIDLDAEYLVFHVSEVSLEECFTYRFAHTDEETIDCAIELVNEVMDGLDTRAALLFENQWWPGLTFTRPEMTRRLLDGVAYANKGIMLDVGHLLSTNTKLRTQAQAVRGLHLHKSLSGEYVEGEGYRVPDDFTGGYWDKYSRCYQHVLQIDRHEPWTDPVVGQLVNSIGPEWVNNELSAWPREPHKQACATQMDALTRGGLVR